MRKFINKTADKITAGMNIGENVFSDTPLIEFTGKEKLRLENHKGIVRYSEAEIMVNTSLGTMVIDGEKMDILSLYDEELVIKGEIYGVRYL